MRLGVRRLLPTSLDNGPMTDAVDLIDQTPFDGITPEKCGLCRLPRPIGTGCILRVLTRLIAAS